VVTGRSAGAVVLQAREGEGGPVWAFARVVVLDDNAPVFFYHGTDKETGRKMLTDDLTPYQGAAFRTLDWTEYTDFGKGLYLHLEATRRLAFEWAKRNSKKTGKEWGVVRFCLLQKELDSLVSAMLRFADKKSRPTNAPVLTPPAVSRSAPGWPSPWPAPNAPVLTAGRPADWLEFVEYNRRIHPQRPGDNDWTGRYSLMEGPIWVPRDSGIDTGGPPFPDDVHQFNCGAEALDLLNRPEVKSRRFLYTKENEP
jgi:hypothetical protein